jgi:drug/metabolite transporter (DMT)-like permease
MIRNKKIEFKHLTTNYWVVFVGISIFLADFFYYQAVAIEGVYLSMISIIRKLSSFLSVVLAGFFLKEDNLIKKILILLLMFVGLAIIIFL